MIKEWVCTIGEMGLPHFTLSKKDHSMRISYDSTGAKMLSLASHGSLFKDVVDGVYKVYPAAEIFFYAVKKYSLHLFFERCRQLRLKISSKEISFEEAEAQYWWKNLNDCFDSIRKEVFSPRYQSMINSYSRAMNKNHKSLCAYIDSLFAVRSRVLVLRLDLSYGEAFCRGDAAVNQFDAKKHRKRLIQNMRANSIFSDILGYAWRLEYAPLKGVHYHFMFFFDGSKVREDISRGDMIGVYWRENVTDGKGLYYNCNKRKHTYRECGVGMISHDDVEGRKNLIKASEYLTKDPLMKFDIDGRCFGRGTIKTKTSSQGRPRKKSANNS